MPTTTEIRHTVLSRDNSLMNSYPSGTKSVKSQKKISWENNDLLKAAKKGKGKQTQHNMSPSRIQSTVSAKVLPHGDSDSVHLLRSLTSLESKFLSHKVKGGGAEEGEHVDSKRRNSGALTSGDEKPRGHGNGFHHRKWNSETVGKGLAVMTTNEKMKEKIDPEFIRPLKYSTYKATLSGQKKPPLALRNLSWKVKDMSAQVPHRVLFEKITRKILKEHGKKKPELTLPDKLKQKFAYHDNVQIKKTENIVNLPKSPSKTGARPVSGIRLRRRGLLNITGGRIDSQSPDIRHKSMEEAKVSELDKSSEVEVNPDDQRLIRISQIRDYFEKPNFDPKLKPRDRERAFDYRLYSPGPVLRNNLQDGGRWDKVKNLVDQYHSPKTTVTKSAYLFMTPD